MMEACACMLAYCACMVASCAFMMTYWICGGKLDPDGILCMHDSKLCIHDDILDP